MPRQIGDVRIDYTLQDGDTDPTDILVDYSTDSGSNFLPATEAEVGSDGTMALGTSASGIAYKFVWDSLTDLGAGVFNDVLVRIRTRSGGLRCVVRVS